MSGIASRRPEGTTKDAKRWAERIAEGAWRPGALCFVLLAGFYLLTAAGNLGETDDVYAFAYRAEHFTLGHLSDPRLMLYHIAMRLLFLASQALGLDVSALVLMRAVSALSAAGALLLVLRIAYADLKVGLPAAFLTAAVLAVCYGFWRYAAEAEVYLPAILLILLVFRGLTRLSAEDGAGGLVTRLLAAAGWGAFAGASVLFYQPAVIPLFFAFPLLLTRRRDFAPLCGYLLAGGAVVCAGYVIGFLAYWQGAPNLAGFISFLSQRSGEFIVPPLSLHTVVVSMIRAAFALGHDIVSANWIFAFDPVTDLIRRAFSNNVITEEIFLAKRAGALAMGAGVTLVLFAVAGAGLLIKARPFAGAPGWRALVAERRVLTLLAWAAINGAIIGRLNPAGVEAWIVVLVPLCLLLGVFAIRPAVARGGARWAVAFAAALFLHNAVGGMALVSDPAGEYDREKGAWVIAEAEPRDLVVIAGNAGLVETLRYLSPAQVALIAVGDAPELAEGLLDRDLSGLHALTQGRDFDDALLRSLLRETARAGGRVILFDEFFQAPAAARGGFWPGLDKLQALRASAQKVYDSDGAGATYVVLPPT